MQDLLWAWCVLISFLEINYYHFYSSLVYLLLAVTVCRENLLLSKNKLATADELFEFSETAVSSCDDSEQFDDGTDRENIKCTTARERLGVWSHDEYSCQGRPIADETSP